MKEALQIASSFVVMSKDFDADIVLAGTDGDEVQRLAQPGEFVIVPRGVWHTAKVREAATMLFVTPGQGTENKAEPDRD